MWATFSHIIKKQTPRSKVYMCIFMYTAVCFSGYFRQEGVRSYQNCSLRRVTNHAVILAFLFLNLISEDNEATVNAANHVFFINSIVIHNDLI